MNNLTDIIDENDKKNIVEIVKLIESKTTGKIKIYICNKSNGNPMVNSRIVFNKLGLRQLKDKNGVLFFISLKDKKIAILGDDEINSKVDMNFWKNTLNAITEKFRNDQFALGLIGGLNLIGEKLMEFFMRQTEEFKEETNDENPIFFEE